MFSFNERLLLFLTLEASILSLIAVCLILLFVIYKFLRRTIRTWGKPGIQNMDATDSSLFLNLMFAEMIQAIGNLPGLRWMEDGHITEGTLCTAQAVLKQVGIVGVAMTSLAIGVHTFSILVLRWRAPQHIAKFMVVGIWIFAALVIGIANIVFRNQKYYGDTGYWCWILLVHETEQIVTEYLWVWIAAFTMIILYGIMFVVMRGWIIIDGGVHWYTSYKPKHPGLTELETEEERQNKEIANLMLFYPAVYVICVLPNSCARWLYFQTHHQYYRFTLLASALFALSGLFNVILFFSTRPDLVKGTPDVIVETDDLPLQDRKEVSPLTPDSRLGRLPERHYTQRSNEYGGSGSEHDAYAYSAAGDRSPTTMGDAWTANLRADPESGFDPHAAALSNSDHHAGGPGMGGAGESLRYTTSPAGLNGSLALPPHVRNSSYRSETSAKRETSLMDDYEEEDYGRLPG